MPVPGRTGPGRGKRCGPVGAGRASGSVSVPGDTDSDGDVDADDAAKLAENWGLNVGTAGAAEGDFDGDGYVGPIDAAIQAGNWTGPGESGSGNSVPEPSTLVAILAGLLSLAWSRHRK